MAEALHEARLARDAGEVPVGAVLLTGHGRIISRAGNAVEKLKDPTAHAEVLALRAGALHLGNHRLEGCVLVVTLEPCLMCAGALAHARLAGVVYGARDSRAGVVESCLDVLDQNFCTHNVWHMGGVCEMECADMLRVFFERRR